MLCREVTRRGRLDESPHKKSLSQVGSPQLDASGWLPWSTDGDLLPSFSSLPDKTSADDGRLCTWASKRAAGL